MEKQVKQLTSQSMLFQGMYFDTWESTLFLDLLRTFYIDVQSTGTGSTFQWSTCHTVPDIFDEWTPEKSLEISVNHVEPFNEQLQLSL